jgi:hypothetical protein
MGNRKSSDCDPEKLRRYEMRKNIERIIEQAEERDRAERLLDMRIRFGAMKGTRIA